ncbi:hypothetical protein R3P38DRAFT_3249103 [Favolaschia claudopus]|uniref:Uncharacterized protein n=1 Tax=Favolaschia claudopus TaxID=2862362 RepID=A0AAW0EEJ4_9AGAR
MVKSTTTAGALDHFRTALELVASLSDGAIHVPCLRAVASAAITIIDIAQAVTKNKEDAIDVAKTAAERTNMLLDILKEKTRDDISLDVQQDIERFAQKLEHVQKVLLKHKAPIVIWKRVVSRASFRDEINRCKDILNESFQTFSASLTLKLHTQFPDRNLAR